MRRATQVALGLLVISMLGLAVDARLGHSRAAAVAEAPTSALFSEEEVQPEATGTADATGTAAEDPLSRLEPDPGFSEAHPAPYAWLKQKWIAHGMGGVQDKRVTNTLEAFEHNYAEGYRVFEVDLVPATDGRLVARHDWEGYLYDFLGQPIDNPYRKLSTEEFKALKVHSSLTPLTVDDVMQVMRAYPDMWVMTDTKGTTESEARASAQDIVRAIGDDTALADRVIVQIYNEPMLATVREVYPFKNIVYTLYQQKDSPERAIAFAQENDIRVIAIPTTMWSPELVRKAQDSGVEVGVYTSNDRDEVKKMRASGVSLIYSDFLSPE